MKRHTPGRIGRWPVAALGLLATLAHAGEAPAQQPVEALLKPLECWTTRPHASPGATFNLPKPVVDEKDPCEGQPSIGFDVTCIRPAARRQAGYAEIRWTARKGEVLDVSRHSAFRFRYKATVPAKTTLGRFFVRFAERWGDGYVLVRDVPLVADGKWHAAQCPLVLDRTYLKVAAWHWRIASFSINCYVRPGQAGKPTACSVRLGGFQFVPKTPAMLAQDARDRSRVEQKLPAILVMMHRAVEGEPEADLRMNHFGLPDPKLRARFKKLGYEVAVAPYASELDMDFLKKFNVLVVPHPYLRGYSPGLDDMAEGKKQLLLDYVKAGGGMLVMRTTGWQFGKDIDEVNRWLGPLGIGVPSEQVVDDAHKIKTESGYELSWTDNIVPHPVTQGVAGLFYTVYHHMYSDSTSPVKVSKDWTVLVKGMTSARSLHTVKGGKPPAPTPGTYASEPPLLAVRDYGKGRVAVWPLNATCVWQDGYHVLWGRGLTMEGKTGNMRGDAAQLLGNLITYLAEPSRGSFGGFAPKRIYVKPEVGFIKIAWDALTLKGPSVPNCYVGLIGAQSSLSSGRGTPAEFIQAAQRAGYDFIAFAEDLRELTEDEFGRLSRACREHSTDKFKAYPGFAYLDDSGNSWVTFSDRVRWPEKGWWSQAHRGRIKINNPLSRGCQWPPVILTQSHRNPEKPWHQGNFKVMALYTYEDGKLVDDSLDHYLRLEKMRYQLAPVAVHMVRSPAEVARAKATGFQTYVRWFDSNMADALSGHIGRYRDRYVWFRSSFVSEGPILQDWRIVNFGTSDLAIPGNDRIRLHVQASSPVGLREVALLDGDSPRAWRRFLPGGRKEFETTLDHFHDRQYALVPRVTDSNGKRAYGWVCCTQVQENSFLRCSDNINTMPRGKWWGTPKHMQNVRGIENYLAVRNSNYVGLPVWPGVMESARPAIAYYPRLACRFVTITDCLIDEHYPLSASGNLNRTDQAERAVPNEYFAGRARHTLFTPWQDGSLVMMVDGAFEVKKDFEFKRGQVLGFQGRRGADCVVGTLRDGQLVCGKLTGKGRHYGGELPQHGFAALLPQPFRGSVGMIALQQGLMFIGFSGGNEYGSFRGRLAPEKQQVKAGQELTYRYLAVNGALDGPPDVRFITDVRDALGLAGEPAYQVEAKCGSVLDTRFVLKLEADGHGFAGRITEAALPMHLPVQIEGLNPRWHAGIWYQGRHVFTNAEWIVNDMNQRYTVRKQRTAVDVIHHFPVLEDGTGYLQIDTSVGDKEVYIGNLLVSDRPEVCLTLVDTRRATRAFVVHNPTDEDIRCHVSPGPGFGLLGAFRKQVTVPAGSSVRVALP